MEPKEIAIQFNETFGLDFHDFYDVDAWKLTKQIYLDIWKFEEWFNAKFPNEREMPLKARIEYQYGANAAKFISEII